MMSDTIRHIANEFGVTVEDMVSNNRKSPIPLARHVAGYFLRTHENHTNEQIALAFGGKNQSSVQYGVERVKKMMESNPVFKRRINRLFDELYDLNDDDKA